jgi:phage-related minor tail protein
MSTSGEEIKVLLTADATQMQAGMEAGADSVEQAVGEMQSITAEEAAAFNAAVQSKIAALTNLNTAFAGNLASSAGMAEAEYALDTAMQAGAVTASEYAGYLDTLNAAEGATVTSTEAVTAAMQINGGTARELGVLIGELARGNYTRLEGSSITLANRTGLLQQAFSPLGMAIIGVGAVIATTVDWMIQGAEESDRMQAALIANGDASGYTYGQLMQLSESLRSTMTTAQQADEAVLKLAQSGRFFGDELGDAARAATNMADVTGSSVDKVVEDMERVAENPVKALRSLNDAYNLISPQEAAEIKRLQDEGETAEAAARAIKDIATVEQQRNSQLQQSEGYVSNFVHTWTSGWTNIKAAVMNWGAPATVQQQLNEVTQEINDFAQKNQGRLTQLDGKIQFDSKGLLPYQIQRVNAMLEQYDTLTKQVTADQQKQQQVAAQGANNQSAVDGILGDKDGAGQLEEQLRKMEADQQVSYDRREEFETAYWQNILATAKKGSADYIEAWQHVQSEQQQLDRQQSEAWQEAQRQKTEASKQAASRAIEDIQMERDATNAASEDRIQADTKWASTALRLYGQDSAQYRAALNARKADTKAYFDELQKEAQQATEAQAAQDKTDLENALSNIQQKRQAAQGAERDGEITAAQLLATQQQLYQQDLNAYAAYLAEKVQLDQGNVKALEKDAQEWVEASRKANQQMQADTSQYQKTLQQQWQQTLRPITQAFDQSITGMIQGTKTLSQTWRSMLADLLMSEIRAGVQMVAHWAATELAKTAATNAGNASRIASNEAAARTGMAQDAAMSEKEIMNSAYTAGAKAYQAVVGIPIVGPVLAPVAAATAFTGVMAFDNIASAAGGWDRVPFDGAKAILHKDEMVLPSHIAGPMRQMAQSGMAAGGSGGQTIHVHANDARSFGQLLQRDPHTFTKAAKKALRVQRNSR